jgi:hypothetical protein
MSLVDWGKTAHRHLTDLLCRRRIVFHHVPKCGGTSVGRSLRRAYSLSQGTVTPEESFKAFSAFARRTDREPSISNELEFREIMLLYLLYSDVRCVSAHVPFSDIAHDIFHGKYLFVTLLRDPVARFVSHYLWSHSRPNGHGHISEEFEDFLTSERAKMLGSTYVRYFCGEPGWAALDMQFAIEAAINNLRRLDHVGFLDEMHQFQGALQQLTGKRLRIGRENVGKKRSTYESIMDGHLRQKIFDVCAPDREIWDAVQDLRNRISKAAEAREDASLRLANRASRVSEPGRRKRYETT